jgi:hypothetical protein
MAVHHVLRGSDMKFKRRFQVISAAMACVVAQSVTVTAAVVEEIVITAQKREQNLQDVGVSVTAFSGDAMREGGRSMPKTSPRKRQVWCSSIPATA